MDNKGVAKSTLVVIVIAIIVVLGIAYFTIFNRPKTVEYFTSKAKQSLESTLIEDTKKLSKIVKEKKIDETMTNAKSFTKENITEYFNDEYFLKKKLAVLVLYEDTSKDYIYSVDSIEYNKDKTEATVKYTYKDGGYAGRLTDSWHNYFFIEVENTVENVEFVMDNSQK